MIWGRKKKSHTDIEEYIISHSRRKKDDVEKFFSLVEKITKEETEVPEMFSGKVVGNFLSIICYIKKPSLCIDVGTFTGNSAFSMAWGVHLSGSGGKVITIEKRKKHVDIFRKLLRLAPFPCNIEIREGEALDILRKIEDGQADVIFVDADKENYPSYLSESKRILKKGGVLIFDNALWGGSVLSPSDPQSRAIAETNKLIRDDPELENVILPIRDGISLCVKK